MLVSSIAQFDAHNTTNNSRFLSSAQNSNKVNNKHTFNGEPGFEFAYNTNKNSRLNVFISELKEKISSKLHDNKLDVIG